MVNRANLQHENAPGPTVWAIGGGKGGIGKSFISSNLAFCLSRLGKTVTLVDLDLGGANLHTCLGLKTPQATLSDFISGRISDLRDLATQTEIPNLSFIGGLNDAFNVADLTQEQRTRILNGLRTLNTQYVIIDLGAGTSETTLDFFLAADQKVVAVTPEPTAIENAYRFMKSAFYLHLRQSEAELGIQKLIEAAMDPRNQHGIRSPSDLVNVITKLDPNAGAQLRTRVDQFRMQIFLNQVRTREDIDLGESIKTVASRYFGVEAGYLGFVDHDNAVWQALRKRRPLMVEFPHSSVVGQFLKITKLLLNPQTFRAVV
ncbi:MAG TPA: P-loop NTPase [Bdellovibrionales bacterium]|jgi:flagellar biosynthesis protein FlhG|nr:P-loop NTPase [Bdellovibrionales bacterium]